MKRTRRVEVIRYRSRVESDDGFDPDINELLALALRPAPYDEKDEQTQSKLLVAQEPGQASRLRRIVRVLKKIRMRRNSDHV